MWWDSLLVLANHVISWGGSDTQRREGESAGSTQALLLPGASSYCSPQDRPGNWERSCWGREGTLFVKPEDWEDDEPVLKSLSPKLGFGLLLYQKEGSRLVIANLLVPESFVLAAVGVGQVTVFLKPSRQLLFSALQLCISIWMEKCYPL